MDVYNIFQFYSERSSYIYIHIIIVIIIVLDPLQDKCLPWKAPPFLSIAVHYRINSVLIISFILGICGRPPTSFAVF